MIDLIFTATKFSLLNEHMFFRVYSIYKQSEIYNAYIAFTPTKLLDILISFDTSKVNINVMLRYI